MNAANFFQTLESRTLFNSVLPPTTDPGNVAALTSATQMEQSIGGGGATADGASGTGSGDHSGTLGINPRRRFSSQMILVD